MPAPSKEQLDRYMDLVVGGEEPEDAIAVIWAEDEKPAAPKKPTVMVTEFPDGVVIGWDHCSRCNASVRKCACKEGPQELAVFEQWRTGSKAMPNYSDSARAAKSDPTTPVAGLGDMPGRPSSDDMPTTPANSVPCREGKHFAAIDQADRNDDGTYTCFACQEAGVQVERDEAQA